MNEIVQNIIAIRKLKGLSQKDMAQKIGIAQSSYSRVEQGKTDLTLSKLSEIAGIFDMTLKDLINWQIPKTVKEASAVKKIEKLKKEIDQLDKDWDQLNIKINDHKQEMQLLAQIRTKKKRALKKLQQDISD